jgi:hypothetical protein
MGIHDHAAGTLMLGIGKLEARLEAQEQATAQHRAWEGERLKAIEQTGEETRTLAQKTNGTVKDHTIELALIKRDEERATELEAARIKAADVASSRRLTWRQGLTFAVVGAVVAGVLGSVSYLVVAVLTAH